MSWKRKIKHLRSLLTPPLVTMNWQAMSTHKRMLDVLHKKSSQILGLEIYKLR